MADIKKFVDRAGVSVLWEQVATKVQAEADRALAAEQANAAVAKAAKDKADANAALMGVLPEGTEAKTIVEYVNKKTEGIATSGALAELQAQVSEHETSLATLEGGEDVEGSVANVAKAAAIAEVASVIANAPQDFDTLKEIADWIANDTTGAAGMANDIAELERLVGSTAVATQISNAIDTALKVEGVDKYALASDLTALAERVKALEDAGHVTQDAIDAGVKAAKDYADSLASNYDAAGTAQTKADAALASAKAYADGLAVNYDAAGTGEAKANQALVDAKAYSDANLATAKSYTDIEVAKIQALTEAEILAAINEVAQA